MRVWILFVTLLVVVVSDALTPEECRHINCFGVGECNTDVNGTFTSCVCDAIGADPALFCGTCKIGFVENNIDRSKHCTECFPASFGLYCNYTSPAAAEAAEPLCGANGVRTSSNTVLPCECINDWTGPFCNTSQVNLNGELCNSYGNFTLKTMSAYTLEFTFECFCEDTTFGATCINGDPGFANISDHGGLSCLNTSVDASVYFDVRPMDGNLSLACNWCKAGYVGSKCQFTNATICNDTEQLCGPGGTCFENRCICSPGWADLTCSTNSSDWRTMACSDRGDYRMIRAMYPSPFVGGYRESCLCDDGFTGEACEYTMVEYEGLYDKMILCSGNGDFARVQQIQPFRMCNCSDGFFSLLNQTECAVNATDCRSIACHGHGECVRNDTAVPFGLECLCDADWMGHSCSVRNSTCAVDYCSGKGTCSLIEPDAPFSRQSTVICTCNSDVSGLSCDSTGNAGNITISTTTTDVLDKPVASAPNGTPASIRGSSGDSVVALTSETPSGFNPSPLRTEIDGHFLASHIRTLASASLQTTPAVTLSFAVSCAIGLMTTSLPVLYINVTSAAGCAVMENNATACNDGVTGSVDPSADMSSFSACSVFLVTDIVANRHTALYVDPSVRPDNDVRFFFAAPNLNVTASTDASTILGVASGSLYFTNDSSTVYGFRMVNVPATETTNCVQTNIYCQDHPEGVVDVYSYNTTTRSVVYLQSITSLTISGLPLDFTNVMYATRTDVFVARSVSGIPVLLKRDPATRLLSVLSFPRTSWLGPAMLGTGDLFVDDGSNIGFTTTDVDGTRFWPIVVNIQRYTDMLPDSITYVASPVPFTPLEPIKTSVATASRILVGSGQMTIVADRIAVFVGHVDGIGWISSVCGSTTSTLDTGGGATCAGFQGQLDDGSGGGVGSSIATIWVDNQWLANTVFISAFPHAVGVPTTSNRRYQLIVQQSNSVSGFVFLIETDQPTRRTPLGFASRHVRSINLRGDCVKGTFSDDGKFYAAQCSTTVHVLYVFDSGWFELLRSFDMPNNATATGVAFSASTDTVRVLTVSWTNYANPQALSSGVLVFDVFSSSEFGTPSVSATEQNGFNQTSISISGSLPTTIPDNACLLQLFVADVVAPEYATVLAELPLTSVYWNGNFTDTVQLPGLANYTARLSITPQPGGNQIFSELFPIVLSGEPYTPLEPMPEPAQSSTTVWKTTDFWIGMSIVFAFIITFIVVMWCNRQPKRMKKSTRVESSNNNDITVEDELESLT